MEEHRQYVCSTPTCRRSADPRFRRISQNRPAAVHPGHRDPAAPLAELLAPAELAATVRAELAAAGLDPDATGWPPPP